VIDRFCCDGNIYIGIEDVDSILSADTGFSLYPTVIDIGTDLSAVSFKLIYKDNLSAGTYSINVISSGCSSTQTKTLYFEVIDTCKPANASLSIDSINSSTGITISATDVYPVSGSSIALLQSADDITFTFLNFISISGAPYNVTSEDINVGTALTCNYYYKLVYRDCESGMTASTSVQYVCGSGSGSGSGGASTFKVNNSLPSGSALNFTSYLAPNITTPLQLTHLTIDGIPDLYINGGTTWEVLSLGGNSWQINNFSGNMYIGGIVPVIYVDLIIVGSVIMTSGLSWEVSGTITI
jgi:hypothetical protein